MMSFNVYEALKSTVGKAVLTKSKRLEMTGFGRSEIPKPEVIKPNRGKVNSELEKFLMMYTCKICNGRNAQMVSKVAYTHGCVVSSCKTCQNKHLIADNEGKMDMAQYGRKIEDFLEAKGEVVQRLSINSQELKDNYLVDKDGVITLVPKIGGQPEDATIVDLEIPPPPQI